MRLSADTDGSLQWLARQHMRPIELSIDDTIEQHFPVRLCFERDE
jgi:hypothetical protein